MQHTTLYCNVLHPSPKNSSSLHDSLEFLQTDPSKPTTARLSEHILHHILRHIFPQLPRYPPQIRQSNLPVLAAREQSKRPLYLFPSAVSTVVLYGIVHLQRRNSHKSLVRHPARSILICYFHELAELGGVSRWEVQCYEAPSDIAGGDDAFFGVLVVGLLSCEESEGFEDFGFLVGRDVVFFGEFGAALCGRFGC